MRPTISILGCGKLGLQLGKKLIEDNYEVKGSTRTPSRIYELADAGIRPYNININQRPNLEVPKQFFNTDILVISLPPKRQLNVEIIFSDQIVAIINLVKEYQISRVLFISSTSVYQETNREVREGEEGIPEKLSGKALIKAENLLLKEKDFYTTVVRFGGLIGLDRNPAHFFSGRKNIPGEVPVNLIHSTDCINIISEIICNNIWGEVFNACCPIHPTRTEFYIQAAEIFGLAIPQFINSTENYKIVNSDKLQKRLGYTFRYASPMDYLAEISI